MIKRILAASLAAIILLAAIPASAADDGFGPWQFSNNSTHTRVSLTDPSVTESGECVYEITHVPSTCLVLGFDVHTCKYCQHTYKDNYLAALGAHDSTDWLPNGDATFFENGTESKICKVCGEVLETRTDDNSSLIRIIIGTGDLSFDMAKDALSVGFNRLVIVVKGIIGIVKSIAG